ncbi:DNA polymerase III subunit gamma/tau [Bacillus sp. FJAT-42376]|uniref:DNA polymerase III subunit gamma/tau n=1 Tax=Bacillus sp. FJAT-42376 TaxID=2014076 RepID=UPI000F5132E5|nr:DNA polymerase III subunit gamma/tau [Bacillus sp. FJAT-42376]AZB41163.1 DNA polymerase III subunit gamma/tau [Bacillus sp. FJAT-42376]
MGYQALYRVFRPQLFEDVAGQNHITRTLQNALLHSKFSHAYLFSGPRGTGKTSAAKIFAKAVNCEKAPVAEPCGECPSCRGIADGSISDVLEIDAASNNGVDEIRDIRDKVKYAPSAVKYKVYIVDEVHMLSMGAFNALLKTLEEPPKHVIFILATTEPHKIPLTIISRCQRFDFKRITSQDIVDRMKTVMDEQEADAEEEALHVIARAADGGMRDALSLLDQAISFSDEKVTLEDALLITGSVSQNLLTDLVMSIQKKEVSAALQILNKLMDQGKDAARFIEDLIYYYRDMLLYNTAPNLEEALERVVVDEAFKDLAKSVETEKIYAIIDVLNKSQQEMKWTNHPRIFLEVAVVKLCETQAKAAVSQGEPDPQLLERISHLEAELRELKKNGAAAGQPAQAQSDQKTSKAVRSNFKVPAGRIQEILKEATRQDLDVLKKSWRGMLDQLRTQNKASHAALVGESEPVAASSKSFVLKFKYEIHCKMVAENNNDVRTNIEAILANLLGKPIEMVGVPERDWGKIREEFIRDQKDEDSDANEEEEDPFIAEAKKLVGDDLIEIKD